MQQINRRSLLSLFGVSTAVVATAAGTEIISDPTVRSLPDDCMEINPAYFDVRPALLYSGITIERNTMKSCYTFYDLTYDDNSSYAETNQEMSFRLAAPSAFAVHKIGVMFSPTVEPKLRSVFAERYSAHLWLQQRSYWHSPVAALFSVGDIENADRPIYGLANVSNDQLPLIIEPNMHYSVTVQSARLLKVHGKIKLWVMMQGLLARSVQ